MRQYSLSTILCIGIALIIMAAGGLNGCGSSKTSSCDCALCVNDQPVYPCDSEASCSDFAATQDCNSWQLVNDATETCGGAPQPRCQVGGCSGQCQCPE